MRSADSRSFSSPARSAEIVTELARRTDDADHNFLNLWSKGSFGHGNPVEPVFLFGFSGAQISEAGSPITVSF